VRDLIGFLITLIDRAREEIVQDRRLTGLARVEAVALRALGAALLPIAVKSIERGAIGHRLGVDLAKHQVGLLLRRLRRGQAGEGAIALYLVVQRQAVIVTAADTQINIIAQLLQGLDRVVAPPLQAVVEGARVLVITLTFGGKAVIKGNEEAAGQSLHLVRFRTARVLSAWIAIVTLLAALGQALITALTLRAGRTTLQAVAGETVIADDRFASLALSSLKVAGLTTVARVAVVTLRDTLLVATVDLRQDLQIVHVPDIHQQIDNQI